MGEATLGAPVHLVKGDDEVLLRDTARRVVHELTGDLDAGLAVEEVGRERFSPPDSSEALSTSRLSSSAPIQGCIFSSSVPGRKPMSSPSGTVTRVMMISE